MVCCCCFRDDGTVEIQNENYSKPITVAEVQPGDQVLTSHGYQPVVYIHRGDVCYGLIQIDFMTHDGRTGSIGLTPPHLIYTEGDSMKKASELLVGDLLQVQGGTAQVTAIKTETAPVRSIVTANGELYVNGVRVSSYAFDERLHHLTQSIAWLGKVSPHLPDKLCRAASPAMCHLVLPLCFDEVGEVKKSLKAAEKEAKAAEGGQPSKHRWDSVRRLTSRLDSLTAC